MDIYRVTFQARHWEPVATAVGGTVSNFTYDLLPIKNAQ